MGDELIDESYWQDENKVEKYLRNLIARKKTDSFEKDKPRDPKGRCTVCLNPDAGVARLLVKIGTTTKEGSSIYACPVCDGGLLDNHDRGSHNM